MVVWEGIEVSSLPSLQHVLICAGWFVVQLIPAPPSVMSYLFLEIHTN